MKYWKTTALGNKVKFLSGGTPKKEEEKYWEGNIPWVSSGEMTKQRIWSTTFSLTEEGAVT
jgi:type I restriction enzyme S subunit